MKKFKKIFPLLLSVMVLMMGSLTVCAADNIGTYSVKEKDYTQLKGLLEYAESKGLELNNKYYVYINQTGTAYMIIADSITSIETSNNGNVKLNFINGYDVSTYSGQCKPTEFCFIPKDKFCTNFNYSDSNYTITANKDGFFPLPPVGKLAENLTEVVTNQTKIIIPIVVGCLALLLGLTLSTRLLNKFLH